VGIAGGATPAASLNGACNCNTASNFEWSSSSRSCVCKAGFYKNGTGCTACGVKKTGECACNSSNSQQFFNGSCICKNTFYKAKNGSCVTCEGLDGVIGDASSTNLGCNCDSSLNYVWSNITFGCVCKAGFIFDLSGICRSCLSIPGALNTTNSTTACNCKPNYKWNIVEEACLCAPNFYFTASLACAACSTLIGTVTPAISDTTTPQGQCKCATGYEWSVKTLSCICKSGTYLSNKTCLNCSSIIGYLAPATSDGFQCECDPIRFFVWNPFQLKCVCLSGYYLKAGLCYSCADMPGYNPTIAATLNNCTCDTAGLFAWNASLFKCVCQPGNYLEEIVCKSCKSIPGAAANGSSSDGKCFCNNTRFFTWNVIANKCICNSSSFITATGNCNTCANISATSLDGISCTCPIDKEWADFKCVCKLGSFLNSALLIPICEDCSTM
jgi:hypothetical protein